MPERSEGMSERFLASGNGLPGLDRVPVWFNDPQNWWGPSGLVTRIREHLVYSAVIVVIAILIALPLGLLIGHTGRGVFLLVGLANGLRAVPTLGLLILLSTWVTPKIHSNAVQNVDPAVRDAARGMGMTGAQIIRKVELPNAMPLIMSGIRSATLQVIATVTVAAYLFLGGLGRYIMDGLSDLRDSQVGYPAMVAAGITVAVLAVLVDGVLALAQRLVVSPGVSGRFSSRRARPGVTTTISVEARLRSE
jgi:osmoprotectant transport system permease protein